MCVGCGRLCGGLCSGHIAVVIKATRCDVAAESYSPQLDIRQVHFQHGAHLKARDNVQESDKDILVEYFFISV